MQTVTRPTPGPSPAGLEPAGYVHIIGAFAAAHRADVLATLRREERLAQRLSPQARILAYDDDGGGLLVSTSSEHLAHRLGESLRRAYGGDVHHGFAHHHTLAFVWWRH